MNTLMNINPWSFLDELLDALTATDQAEKLAGNAEFGMRNSE